LQRPAAGNKVRRPNVTVLTSHRFPEQRFRRTVRHLTARYLGQRLSYGEFRAAIRDAAVEAGILESGRVTRDDRVMNALAWGTGSIEPGHLPALLEPLFRQLESGQIQKEFYAQQVRRLLDQIKAPE
jgi:hypothetical protein